MENPHSLSCIQSVYRRNPASPLLHGMVQTFVNNAQETLDCLSGQTDGQEKEEWLKTLNVAPTYKEEVDAFIDFANRVAGQKETASPALWKSAAAMLHYIYKDYDSANREINEAMTMRGDPCVKDNARAIRLLLSGTKTTGIAGYSDFLAGELAWLDTKAALRPAPILRRLGEVPQSTETSPAVTGAAGLRPAQRLRRPVYVST